MENSMTGMDYKIQEVAGRIRALREISGLLLQLDTNDPYRVFGTPDDMKLCSSMTLFALVSEEGSVFHKVLDKYYGGHMDAATLRILGMK